MLYDNLVLCRYDEIVDKLKPYLKKTGFKGSGIIIL